MAETQWHRLFIAVELPEGIKTILNNEIARLKPQLSKSFRWVATSNIHLTLKFLGDVDMNRADNVARTLMDAVRPLTPFTLKLHGAGTFSHGGRPSVVWAGVDGDVGALDVLRDAVEASFTFGEEPQGKQRFQAHLTLARIRDMLSPNELDALIALLAKISYPVETKFKVADVSLVHSVLGRNGASHTTFAHAPLEGS